MPRRVIHVAVKCPIKSSIDALRQAGNSEAGVEERKCRKISDRTPSEAEQEKKENVGEGCCGLLHVAGSRYPGSSAQILEPVNLWSIDPMYVSDSSIEKIHGGRRS